MTSWMKERDRLVEQTLAFVQGVAAQRPIQVAVAEVSPRSQCAVVETVVPRQPQETENDPASAETDALTSLIAFPQPENPHDKTALPSTPIAVVEIADSVRTEVKPALPRPAIVTPIEMTMPERDVIAQRVARFRAGQQKLIRDRDDNYALVQAKIRESLRATFGNDPKA